ncbi:MAG: GAF domain-containing protein [Anaerolineaceae bacterium]|nr:GAF domain-containing protein [Anaerolineaceae bacterium]
MNKQPHRVLIVDNNKNSRETLEEILRKQGIKSIGADSEKEAIEHIQTGDFSLALINFQLDNISGLDILNAINSISPNTECIVLTNSACTQSAIQAVKQGAYSYLQNPYDVERLAVMIRHALEKKETTRALTNAEERYAQLFNSNKDGIVATSLRGEILEFNNSFQKMVSYSGDELREMSFWDLTPKKWHAMEKKIVEKQIIERGYSDLYEKEYKRKDGTIFPIEVSAYLSKGSGNKRESMWAFVRDISERKQSEAALKRQLQEVTILQDLTSASLIATDIDDLVQTATTILGKSLYPEYFGIFLYNAEKEILHRHYSYKTSVKNDVFEEYSQPINIGILGRAVRTRLPQRITDVSKDEDYHQAYREIRSELVVPIITGNKVFGVINAESPIIGYFTEKDEKMLTSLANQLSIGITKIQLDKSEKQQAKEITALYDAAIATSSILDTGSLYQKIYEQVQELFPLDTFLLMEYDDQNEISKIAYVMEEGKPLKDWLGRTFEKSESGMIGWVIQQRRPFLSRDLTTETLSVQSHSSGKPARSWLGVPLITKGKVVGGLSVQAFAPNVFNENHQRLLESLAAQLASAIDNAQLSEKSQRQIERLKALHDIDLVINSSLDLRVTLNILLDQVVEKLQVDAAVVLLLNPKSNILEYSASRGFRTQTIQQYHLHMGEGLSGKTAVERHLVQAFNLTEIDNNLAYTNIMQEENFVSYFSVPLIAKGQVKGMLDIFNRTLLNPDQEWYNFMETLGGQAAIAIDNTSLLEDLHRSNIELSLAYDSTLEGWSKALDLRDKETEGHTQRVVEMTLHIAQVLGVQEEEMIHIRRGALLHDIGKMGIPDSILLKPGPLTDEEWEIMRRHPVYAYELLHPIVHLRPALDIPYCHHERWDGTGYPRKLRGKEIPLAGRIFSVVDVWDAIISDRPYRKAWSAKKALDYIQSQKGKHFDPQVVDIFTSLVKSELIRRQK